MMEEIDLTGEQGERASKTSENVYREELTVITPSHSEVNQKDIQAIERRTITRVR
jgi:hypothetical protein